MTDETAQDNPYGALVGANYDKLEKALTENLGIKVVLVRDWETPSAIFNAQAELQFKNMYGTDAEKAQARRTYNDTERRMLNELRGAVASRDADIANSLTDNELRSLKEVRHVTVRGGNAEPEQAVIIFDPGAQSKSFPSENPVLRDLLGEKFDNAWSKRDDEATWTVKTAGLVENFNVSASDLRIYRALQQVRYALRNQQQFNNLGKNWYYEAPYHRFAGTAVNREQLWAADSSTPFADVVKKYEAFQWSKFTKYGVTDPDLNKKLLMASAIKALVWNASAPNETFARLGYNADQLPQTEILAIQRNLSDRLREKLKEYRPVPTEETYNHNFDGRGLSDLRILFPVFREVYEKDASTGPARKYLDTIMEGLQSWFPTVTNGPVPDISNDSAEPSRRLANAPAQKPSRKPSKGKPAP